MNTCKTCKHWDDKNTAHSDSINCWCNKLNLGPSDKSVYERTGEEPVTHTCDGYGSYYTSPDFGCVLHETK